MFRFVFVVFLCIPVLCVEVVALSDSVFESEYHQLRKNDKPAFLWKKLSPQNDVDLISYQKILLDNYLYAKDMRDTSHVIRMGYLLCRILHFEGFHSKELNYLLEILEMAKQTNDSFMLGEIYNLLGGVYYNLTNYEMSLMYFKRSLTFRELSENQLGIGSSYNNIGDSYLKTGKYELALAFFYKARDINLRLNKFDRLSIIYANIGDVFLAQGNHKQALENYEKCIELSDTTQNLGYRSYAYNVMGNYYLAQKETSKALDAFMKALKLTSNNGFHSQKTVAVKGIYEIYMNRKAYKKALEYMLLYKELEDSLFNQELADKLLKMEMQLQFQDLEKEQQFEQEKIRLEYQAKLTRQKIVRNFFIGISFIFFMMLYAFYKNYRIKKKSHQTLELTNAELVRQQNISDEQRKKIYEQNKELKMHREHLLELVEERTRELQIAKEKAEQADRLKSMFLTNLSHEIRTPMNAIVGFSDLMKEPALPIKQREQYGKYIMQNVEKLLSMIDSIMELAKMETDQITFSLNPYKVQDLLLDVKESFQRKVFHKDNITVEMIVNGQAHDLEVKTDKQQFMQVFGILMSNAIIFTEAGEIVWGIHKTDNRDVVFFIKDTGIGIASGEHEKIFERFYKVEHESILYPGAGLGLYKAKKILEKMNGKIWLDSTPGEGSSFYFSLPLTQISHSKRSERMA